MIYVAYDKQEQQNKRYCNSVEPATSNRPVLMVV